MSCCSGSPTLSEEDAILTPDMKENYSLKVPWIVSKLFQMGFGVAKMLLGAPPEPGVLLDSRNLNDSSPYKFVEVVPDQLWLVLYSYQPEAQLASMMIGAFADPVMRARIVKQCSNDDDRKLATDDMAKAMDCCNVPKSEVAAGGLLKRGLKLQNTMIVVKLKTTGKLFLYSPVKVDDELRTWLDARGGVGHMLAPSAAHVLFTKSAALAYPDAAVSAGQVAAIKLRKAGIRIDWEYGGAPETPAASAVRAAIADGGVRVIVLDSDPNQEACLLHEPTKALVCCDMLYHGENAHRFTLPKETWKDADQWSMRCFYRQFFHPEFADGALPCYRWQFFLDKEFPVAPRPKPDALKRFGASMRDLIALDYTYVVAAHVDHALSGDDGRALLIKSWSWAMNVGKADAAHGDAAEATGAPAANVV